MRCLISVAITRLMKTVSAFVQRIESGTGRYGRGAGPNEINDQFGRRRTTNEAPPTSVFRRYTASGGGQLHRRCNRSCGQATPRYCAVSTAILMAAAASFHAPTVAAAAEETKTLRYEIDEEVPSGTFVGDLIEDAGLRKHYSNDIVRSLRFRFLAEAVEYFEVGEKNGYLRTAGDLDRDSPSLCRQKDTCEISLDIVLQPAQYFQIIKVKVEILDKNDNPPVFRETQVYLPIVEAAPIGSVYVLPTASDVDAPAHGILRYELDSPTDKFSLESSSKIDGTLEAKLILREKLDREIEAQYRLILTAVDSGDSSSRRSPKTGTSTIIVNVMDSNDNKPRFLQTQYDVSIPENIPTGSTILQVQATDKDVGPNGQIEYSFTSQDASIARPDIRNSKLDWRHIRSQQHRSRA